MAPRGARNRYVAPEQPRRRSPSPVAGGQKQDDTTRWNNLRDFRDNSEIAKILAKRSLHVARPEDVMSEVPDPKNECVYSLPANDPEDDFDWETIGQKTTRSRSGSREKILKDSAAQAAPSTRETAQVVKSVVQEK